MKNWGGTFPIGEIFTEPKDLTAVNGEASIFGYPNIERKLTVAPPFKVIITLSINYSS